MAQPFDTQRALSLSDEVWEEEIVPALARLHPHPQQVARVRSRLGGSGHMDRAVAAHRRLVPRAARTSPGLVVEVVRLERAHAASSSWRCPATGDETVLLYGHLDKQPEMTGWRAGALARGSRCARATSSTAAAAPTTATRPSPRWRRCASSQEQRQAARPLRGAHRGLRGERLVPTCRRTSSTSRRASARRRWWCASTRAAATTSSCG